MKHCKQPELDLSDGEWLRQNAIDEMLIKYPSMKDEIYGDRDGPQNYMIAYVVCGEPRGWEGLFDEPLPKDNLGRFLHDI